MAGQRGRDILLKISDGGSPASFVTLAGIRSNEIELNSRAVDSTSAESAGGWRELIAGAGIKSARVRGRGVFKDSESDRRMREVFFSGEATGWQLVVPGLGTLEAPMQITELRWGGEHDGEATFSIELQSAGQIVFSETTS